MSLSKINQAAVCEKIQAEMSEQLYVQNEEYIRKKVRDAVTTLARHGFDVYMNGHFNSSDRSMLDIAYAYKMHECLHDEQTLNYLQTAVTLQQCRDAVFRVLARMMT